MMSENKENKLPEFRIPRARQTGGIILAPGGSKVVPESCEGPSGGLIASLPMDRAIAEQEEDCVVAARPGPGKRSPRGSNPRMVAVVKLDKGIKLVPGSPPPLGVRELDSPEYTESAPELESESLEGTAATQTPRPGEEPARATDLDEDADSEGSTAEEVMRISPEEGAGRSKKKRERMPGSGSDSDKKATSSKAPRAIQKMKRAKTSMIRSGSCVRIQANERHILKSPESWL